MKEISWTQHKKAAALFNGTGPLFVTLSRLIEYAEETGIKLVESNCYTGWTQAGLSNLRGFAPQRRLILVNKKDPFIEGRGSLIQNDEALEHFLWHVHDLLHIVYYDFSNLEYVGGEWSSQEFFIPVHLCSEALAVLMLDYWGLVQSHLKSFKTKRFHESGLAVDIHVAKLKEVLDFYSDDFINALLDLYCLGQSSFFAKLALSKNLVVRNWVGHEMRYADRQHQYALNWWRFLHGEPVKDDVKLQIFNHDPEATGGLQKLREIFSGVDGAPFRQFLATQSKAFQNFESYFPFEETNPDKVSNDFRMKNAFSLSKTKLQKLLVLDYTLNPSFHFLIGQILCALDPKKHSVLFNLAERVFGAEGSGKMGALQKTRELLLDEVRSHLDEAYEGAGFNHPNLFLLS